MTKLKIKEPGCSPLSIGRIGSGSGDAPASALEGTGYGVVPALGEGVGCAVGISTDHIKKI